MANRRHVVPLIVTEAGYTPSTKEGREQHEKFKVGSTVGGEIARSRSVVQNARYWAILTRVVEHFPGRWRTPEALHEVLKCATGRLEIVQLVDGRLVKIPDSTAFSRMSQDQFNDYSEQAFRVIEEEILGHEMTVDELLVNTDGNDHIVGLMVKAGNLGG